MFSVLVSIRIFLSLQAWDFEKINMATINSSSSRFEVEPINELLVGHNVCLSSVVRSSVPDSFIWFAQVREHEAP